jgi:arylsulfatase A-like enzyme
MRCFGVIVAALLLTACPEEGGAPTERDDPNVLLLIADDFGLDRASFNAASPCYDIGDTGDDPPMPNLAALCAGGVRFENAWAMPLCSPTRASLLTGRFPYQTGVGYAVTGSGANNPLDLSTPTLPSLLAEHAPAYATANIGKWHLSLGAQDPNEAGWGHFAGLIRGTLPSYTSWTRVVDGIDGVEQGYATTVNVNDAIDWLDGLAEGQPWLLWMGFNAPHTPFHKPPDDLHDYDHLAPADNVVPAEAEEYFRASLQALDTEIGRLFNHLQATERWDDTVVIFVGDNGTAGEIIGEPFDSTHGKGTLYEGGIAVPLVVSGPGISAGRSVEAIVSSADLFATILEAAGVDAAAVTAGDPVDSVSLWPQLVGPTSVGPREHMISEVFGPQGAQSRPEGHAIRNQQHKLICFPDDDVELFDLSVDRWESNNLYQGSPAAGLELVYSELSTTLEQWITADICP